MSDGGRMVESIARTLEPKPMDRSQRIAFAQAVEARLERRRFARRSGALAVAVSAAAALVVWLGTSSIPTEAPVEIAREEASSPATSVTTAFPAEEEEDADVALLVAYSDPDEIDDVEPTDYLPDDYFVLASLVEELDG